MKRLLILSAILVMPASHAPSAFGAEMIACAKQAPSPIKGRWYYRIIDGRKCWYEGKPMMSKSALYWPKAPAAQAPAPKSVAEADSPGASTDGRNIGAIGATPPAAAPVPQTAQPAAWPAPVADDGSFESRWRGLQSGS
jgi:hypothetical protein